MAILDFESDDKGTDGQSIETKASASRQKRQHHKVRTGCLTCKQRRVRCDESKPRCRNCVKIDHECVYQIPRTWYFEKNEGELMLQKPLSQFPSYSNINKDAPIFQYFCENSLPQLTGFRADVYFPSTEDDSQLMLRDFGKPPLGIDATAFDTLWRRLIVKVASTEPLVWRLMCSYAEQQRKGVYGRSSEEAVSMAEAYSRAMIQLVKAIDLGASIETVAISTFLIFALERMSSSIGSIQESFALFEKGSALLLSLKTNDLVSDNLLPARTQFINIAVYFQTFYHISFTGRTALTLPRSFHCTTEAKYWFLRVCQYPHHCYCTDVEHWTTQCTALQTIQALLESWTDLITQYFETQKGVNDLEAQRAFSLRAQSYLIEVALTMSMDKTTVIPDYERPADPSELVSRIALTETEFIEHDCMSSRGLYGPCKICWG